MTADRELRSLFDAADLDRIRRAVDEAEGRTSGEIVPYVVARSDEYRLGVWTAATLGALGGALAAAAALWALDPWGAPAPLWALAPPALGGVAGYLAASLSPALRRLLVPDAVVDLRTQRRASQAFLEEEVFRTRERTGILIFLSLLERRVVVLGDSGINSRVEPGEWEGIVAGIVAGIRRGEPAAALVEAIGRCGELLERRGVERRPDDRDELADGLRTRDR